MEWLHPEYAPAFVLLFITAAFILWALYKSHQIARKFGDYPLVRQLTRTVHPVRRGLKLTLFLLGLALMILALIGPRYGIKPKEVKREGLDLIIALDLSNSMLAEDVPPNRLQRARHEINKLLDVLTSDRVGLVFFAGDAFLQCPLTMDYSAVRMFLELADPTLMPAQGTNFGAALRTAIQAFESTQQTSDKVPTRVLLIVSDGENHEGDTDKLVKEARKAGIYILTAGVGEPQGAPIPIYRNGRRIGFKEDERGNLIRSRLVEHDLKALATRGAYIHIGRSEGSLREIADILNTLDKNTFETTVYEDYVERYQWPLVAGLLLWLLALMLPEIRKTTHTTIA